MMRRSFGSMWANTSQTLGRMPVGGRWALALPGEVLHNLRWFWFDGLFAVASDNIIITYVTVYVLALGATRTQIGLMSALSSLSAALLLLPGALLVERIGHRKQITLVGGGGFARLAILGLALIPLASNYPAVVWIAIALAVTRDAFANLSFPAWMSLASDMVPTEGRGRYFGSRNFAIGIGAMVTTLLVGEMITRLGAPKGYQIALMLAFALGVRRALHPRGGSAWGPLLIGIYAIGLLGAGIFPTDPLNGYPPGTSDKMTYSSVHGVLHGLFSTLVFSGLPIACFVFARRFVRWGERGWTIYSTVTGLAFAITFILTSAGFGQAEGLVELAGLFQRITLTIGWAWMTLLAVHLLQSREEAPRTREL